jgi:hypothetical protein
MYKGKPIGKTNPQPFNSSPPHEKTLEFLVGTTPSFVGCPTFGGQFIVGLFLLEVLNGA